MTFYFDIGLVRIEIICTYEASIENLNVYLFKLKSLNSSKRYLNWILGFSIYYLKLNISNFTLTVRTPSDDHKFLHFLSHFEKKEVENVLPRPGFELAIN